MVSSIRDFDPLLKRKAQTRVVTTASAAEPVISSGRASPIRISVGRTHIRADATGGAAALGRNLNEAFRELSENFQWFTDQLDGYLPQDLKEALIPTFMKSQEYCPVGPTGNLKASGFLEVEGFRGGARAVIGYGKGGDPFYAIYVHEVPATHDPPTTDKFLQKALDEDYYAILQRVTEAVKIRTGG